MNKVHKFQSQFNAAGVWRAQEQDKSTQPSVASQYANLDAALPGGGWPQGAITEILCSQEGIGELRLVMAALAQLSHEGRWLTWVAPPYVPYAPALAAHGVDVSKILVVHAKAHDDMLWAAEQALRSGTCGAVLMWVQNIKDRQLHRLQLAAKEGGSLGLLFRPSWSAEQASPAVVRVQLHGTQEELQLDIIKRRGAWPTGPIHLDNKQFDA